ncbi:MAG: DUF1629 domain-containing protein [Pseudomonadota bacterium]|nr:DUF1629 domain-containing protein [Pseudomonadota bacterium]
MTDQASIPVTYHHTPQKGRFYVIEPDLRGGGKGHGLEIANENKLCAPGWIVMMPPNGNPDQYPEKPHLVQIKKNSGRMPRDLEGLAGIWIVSEQAKQVFESVDPEGFAFTACDFTLSDGSPGPQYYLCGILRTLDALNEEESRLKIEIGDYVNGKYYNRSGGASLVFKEDVVGAAHVFYTPFDLTVFCDRRLRDAVKAAELTGARLTDVANC